MKSREITIAKATMFTALYLGRASMLLFVVFLFVGSLGLTELGFSDTTTLIWNGFLSLLFFLQHSAMIRRGSRAFLARILPRHYIDAVFSLTSSVVLIGVIVLWQTSPTMITELDGLARWAARGVFIMGLAGTVWGALTFKSLDPFGNKAIRDHLKGRPAREIGFQAKGPYLWVRHPLYLFQLMMIWSCPDLTMDRLLFNLLWTAWIYVGTVLEERDLVADFGQDYRNYQKQVPMLVPWKMPSRASRQNA
jgi:protein-S-isoprenylcysteine O-methyltransferase Ste14